MKVPWNVLFGDCLLMLLRLRANPGAIAARGAFEGGEFAVTTHAGPLATLPAAYAAIFPRVTR